MRVGGVVAVIVALGVVVFFSVFVALFFVVLLGFAVFLVAVVVLVLEEAFVADQVDVFRQIDRRHIAQGADGVVKRRLESLDVKKRLRFVQLGDLLRADFELVRLGARGGDGRDVDVVAADLLREPLDRIERGGHF